MNVEIETQGVEAVQRINQLAHGCAGYELGTVEQQVDQVKIRVAAIPETRRGRQTNCVVRVDFYDGGEAFAEATDANPYVAIHWALERVGRKIARQGRRADASQRGLPDAA